MGFVFAFGLLVAELHCMASGVEVLRVCFWLNGPIVTSGL